MYKLVLVLAKENSKLIILHHQTGSPESYHSGNCIRFLCPEGLHNLEYIHHTLGLASFNGTQGSTEHTTATNCVPALGEGEACQHVPDSEL